MRTIRHARRGVLAGALIAAVLCSSAVALAQGLSPEERQAAAEAAYDRGSNAYRTGDYDSAARWYETANELAPSANALIQAMRAHERAGNVLRAATLGVELKSRYGEERMGRYADESIARAAETGVRVDIQCEECEIAVNGEPEPRRTLYLRPDTQQLIVATFPTGTVEERVLAGPGESRTLALEAPAPEPAATGTETPDTHEPATPAVEVGVGTGSRTRDGGGGIAPGFFWTGLALTVISGGVLAWSGFDTLEKRDDYVDMPTRPKLDHGRDLEMRTNILIGTTAGLGAVTILLLALTDFSGGDGADEEPLETSLAPLPEGGLLLSASGSLP